MAIFREFRPRENRGEEDMANFIFTVVMDGQDESRAWEYLAEGNEVLEREIREAVQETLGPEFTISHMAFARGSIEILFGIAATAYAGYVGVSRYKNFVESLNILARQFRSIIQRFFRRLSPGPMVVTGTWIPGPMLQQQSLSVRRSFEPLSFTLVLGYLILSHAALLAVLIWRVVHQGLHQ